MISHFVIWTSVVLYLLWLHVYAAFSEPMIPMRATLMPSLMAVLLGSGLSGVVILRDLTPLTRLDADATMVRP